MARQVIEKDLFRESRNLVEFILFAWILMFLLCASSVLVLIIDISNMSTGLALIIMVCLIMPLLVLTAYDSQMRRLGQDLQDTRQLIFATLMKNPEIVRRELAQQADALEAAFFNQQHMQRLDETDVDDQTSLERLQRQIQEDKESFWRLRNTAVRWGLVPAAETDTIRKCTLLMNTSAT